jgi:hypothetical protein
MTVWNPGPLGSPAALQKAKYNVDKHFAVVGLLGKNIKYQRDGSVRF